MVLSGTTNMPVSRRVVEIDTTYRPRGLLRILGGDADPKPPSHMAAALRALSKALAGRRRPFQLGHVFMLVGGFCIASTAALLAGAFLLPSDIWSRINNGVIGRFLPFAGIAWMPGFLLLFRGQRMMNANAERVLRETGQKPILFLRPFHTDSWATASLGDEEPFDVIIARCFGSYGPVISVARPGERRFGRQAADRAIYGMSREYFSDDGWRDGVVRRMQEALLTVVVAGSTGGLKWELEQLVGSGHLSKLIILRGPIKDTKAAGARMLHDTLR